jgi:hypothetical protein
MVLFKLNYYIFHRAAKAMGRNSNEAILADARELLENMAVNNLDMSEIQTSKWKRDSNIGKWVSLVLIPMIQDSDIRWLIAPTKWEEGRYILQNIKPYQALWGKLYKRLWKYHTPK